MEELAEDLAAFQNPPMSEVVRQFKRAAEAHEVMADTFIRLIRERDGDGRMRYDK